MDSACPRGIRSSHSSVEFQRGGPRCTMVVSRSSCRQCGFTPAYHTVSGRVSATTSYFRPCLASCARRLSRQAANEDHCETARMKFSVCAKKPERKQPRVSAPGRKGPVCEPFACRASVTGRKAQAAVQSGSSIPLDKASNFHSRCVFGASSTSFRCMKTSGAAATRPTPPKPSTKLRFRLRHACS